VQELQDIRVHVTFLLLVTNRHFREKVYEKLRRIFGDSKRTTTSRDLREMDYLGLCIKEAMRIFVVASRIARYLTRDVTVCKYGAGRVVPEDPAVQHDTPNLR
jgi:cytochrome P450 family 4